MVAHALEDAPDECCGMVGTRDGEAVSVHRVVNAKRSPLRFEMDPKGQYDAWTTIEDAGLETGVIYHSHTRSDPVPSETDRNMAVRFWPDPVWVIVGVQDPAAPEVRAWQLVDGAFVESELEVV